jgi:hypothetical protein
MLHLGGTPYIAIGWIIRPELFISLSHWPNRCAWLVSIHVGMTRPENAAARRPPICTRVPYHSLMLFAAMPRKGIQKSKR